MGLLDTPPTRERTYVNGTTPVDAGDLNLIQDLLIQHAEEKWYWFAIGKGRVESNITYASADLYASANAGSAVLALAIPTPPVGFVFTEIGAVVKGTGGAQTVTVDLDQFRAIGGTGFFSAIDTLSIVNPANTWSKNTVALATPEEVLDADAYQFYCSLPLNTTAIAAVGYKGYLPWT